MQTLLFLSCLLPLSFAVIADRKIEKLSSVESWFYQDRFYRLVLSLILTLCIYRGIDSLSKKKSTQALNKESLMLTLWLCVFIVGKFFGIILALAVGFITISVLGIFLRPLSDSLQAQVAQLIRIPCYIYGLYHFIQLRPLLGEFGLGLFLKLIILGVSFVVLLYFFNFNPLSVGLKYAFGLGLARWIYTLTFRSFSSFLGLLILFFYEGRLRDSNLTNSQQSWFKKDHAYIWMAAVSLFDCFMSYNL